ncbi:hypothetical protein Hdeb2414_s0002g00062851 [Helianthus debilis subsp. tardiflorus]
MLPLYLTILHVQYDWWLRSWSVMPPSGDTPQVDFGGVTAITLNNFLLSYEKTTPEVLTMLRKIRDEI